MSIYTFLSGLLCGLYLLSGLFSLYLAVRRIEREINLAYFGLALCIGAVLTHNLVAGFTQDVPSAILNDKFVNSFLMLAGIAFLFMIRSMTGYRSAVFHWILVIGLSLFVVVNWIAPYGVTWSHIYGIVETSELWFDVRYVLHGEPGVLNLVSIVLILSLCVYSGLSILHQIRHGEKKYALRLALAIGFALFGQLVDAILLQFNMQTIGIIDDIGFFGFAFIIGHRNIRNLIQTNEAIRENEERLARLTEAAFEGIAFTEHGRIVDVNRQLAAMLGCGVEEMIGKPVVDFVDTQSTAYVEKMQQQAVDSSYEHLARHKNGSAIPVEVKVKNVVLKDRVVRVTVIRDISERKKAEAENTLLAKTIKSVRDCISVTDLNNRLVFVNDAFLQAYGYTEAEVLGQPMKMFRAEDDLNTTENEIRKDVEAAGEWYGEIMNIRKDGEEFPIELWASQVKDAGGNVVAYVGVARDISERKRYEEALVSEKERAERSDRLKDAFIANISHEVRTPLNVIVGYTGLISECMVSKANDEEMQYFDSVQRGAQRLMRTVDMILSISRLQVGDFELAPRSLNILEIIKQMVDDYSATARSKDLSLSLVVETGDVEIVSDEYCFVQSLHNLLDNALKYTREGSVTVRVFTGAAQQLCVSIKDTGVGISPDYLTAVFEPYTQEDSGYSRSYDGIGLGLSLVKRYSELNGISVDLESSKGVGSTVTLSFPSALKKLPADEHSQLLTDTETPGTMDATDSPPQLSLLLVEDDALTIEFMRTILSRDYEVHIATSADEAYEVLAGNYVDFILMDISLNGDKNGLELTKELKQSDTWRHIPIIAATAHAFPDDRERCLEAGCDEYISKPIQTALLVRLINGLSIKGRMTLSGD